MNFHIPAPYAIIPYQEINGNYNSWEACTPCAAIIPYQEINGNYNLLVISRVARPIIPYQEINGNYNEISDIMKVGGLYHTKK